MIIQPKNTLQSIAKSAINHQNSLDSWPELKHPSVISLTPKEGMVPNSWEISILLSLYALRTSKICPDLSCEIIPLNGVSGYFTIFFAKSKSRDFSSIAVLTS